MRIAALRARLRLTQAGLARLVGVHPMTVSKWERGVLRPTAHQRALLATLGAAPGKAARAAAGGPAQELAAYLSLAFVDATEIGDMQLSASNQWKGKIVELDEGPVSARVVIEIAPKIRIVSVITTASVRRLGLKVGRSAVAIVKATEVIVGAP